ncbi:ribonuclease R [Buchnera aphidicola]|uniref:ribonuclease R n=1 Tax=Buchnera aphidicola TaxID=9 RepID=UPI0031B71881
MKNKQCYLIKVQIKDFFKKVILLNGNTMINKKKILNWIVFYQKIIDFNKLLFVLNLNIKLKKEFLTSPITFIKNNNKVFLFFCKKKNLISLLKPIKGEIIGHKDGYGFLKTSLFDKDFWISQQQMNPYIHGDIVLVRLVKISWSKNNKIKIIKLLKPNYQNIIGKYCIRKNSVFVHPYNKKFNFKISIPLEKKNNNLSNSMVSTKLIQRPQKNKNAVGEVVEILGQNINIFLIKKIVLQTYNIPILWSKKLKKELFLLEKNDLLKRNNDYIDMTHLPLITVDDENAKDFDDAVFCKKNKNSEWVLYVAIADVSHYIEENSVLDREALNRGNSIYFPTNEVIPMLPEKISEDLCSLIPHKKKLALICEVTITESGKLIKYKHYKAKINSFARLTYTELNSIWNGNKILSKKYNDIIEHLLNLLLFYSSLKRLILFKNSLFLNRVEPKFILDKYLKIKKVNLFIRNKAHKLIELCMLTANVVSTYFILKNKSKALFRVHEKPSKENIFRFRKILQSLGLNIIKNNSPTYNDYLNFLKEIRFRSDREVIQIFFLRAMKQAKYSSINAGHFGLSLPGYVHFTSPIRRYPDLLIHRIIKNLISKKKFVFFNKNNLENIANHCSMTERRAELASKEVLEWMKYEFIKNKMKNTFVAIIFNILKDEIIVRLKNLFIDGFIKIKKLSTDNYIFNNKKKEIIRKHTNKVYSLGGKLLVKISAIHSEDRRIQFDIV